jgi:hypothetical protein
MIQLLIQLLFFLILLAMWYFLFGNGIFPYFKKHSRLINNGCTEVQSNISTDSEITVDEKKENGAVEPIQNIPVKYADVIEMMKRIVEMDEAFLRQIKTDENLETSQKELKNMLFLRMKTIEDLTKRYAIIFNTDNEESQKFAQSLLHKFPELNKKEVRLCYYFKLNLSSKEISNLEGLTNGSVRVYKTKLKNKLGLKYEDNLNKYLELI